MKKIKVTVEKTNTGFSAYVEKYPVVTTGSNIPELRANMIEALNLYFEGSGKGVAPGDIVFNLDIPQFFGFYKVINAKGLAERIGMNYTLLSQYVQGRKNPHLSRWKNS
jgi:hypothetical protein